MFRLDELSVVEWLTTTRWELEMSAEDRDARGLAERATSRAPRFGAESTACEELAWSLIVRAGWDLQRKLLGPAVTYAD